MISNQGSMSMDIDALRASAAPEEGKRRNAMALEIANAIRVPHDLPPLKTISEEAARTIGVVEGYSCADRILALSPDSRKAEPETDELGLFELGQSFLEEYERYVSEGAFPNFICADSPVEIIVHLINERDEARAALTPATEDGE